MDLVSIYKALGWNDEASINADIAAGHGEEKLRAYGGSDGSGGGSTAESFADSLIKAQQDTIKRETEYLEQYTATNPFVFDEQLAKKSATEEYTPYYSELLSDYVSNLDIQRQTTRGESKLLTTLQGLDTSARTRAYDQAVGKAEEGFAGQGLFFSGIKNRATGLEEIGYKEGMQGSEARFGEEQAGLTRQIGQYDVAQQRKERDIGREEKYAIEGGVLTRKKEAVSQYYTPLEQSFYRQFPTSGGGALKGYQVPEYFRV